MYIVKTRYYAESDFFGETFVLTSDNGNKDLKLEIGQKVKIIPICKCDPSGEKECQCNKE